MDSYNERLDRVLRHLEEHLDEAIDVSGLASIACYSDFHFHRIFRAYTGESVYGHRKRLLLERAARQLLETKDDIGDVSVRAGYETQSSFNKAFKAMFEQSPGAFRRVGRVLPSFVSAMSETREKTVKPTFKTIEDIDLICARETGAYAEASPAAWGRIMKFAYSNRLMNSKVRLFGIPHDDPTITGEDHIRYDAGVDIKTELTLDDGLFRTTLPGGKYAVFLHKGPYENFSATYSLIYGPWLQASGETLRDSRSFEIYLNRDPRRTKPENLKTEIWVPLT